MFIRYIKVFIWLNTIIICGVACRLCKKIIGDMLKKFIIYTDGAARGNPGRSASGYEIYENGKLVAGDVFYNGVNTNNFAEYNAVIKALEWCVKNSDPDKTEVELFSDSELVIGQLRGEYKVKAPRIKPLYRGAVELLSKFKKIDFNNVPRENNGISRVDKKLNIFLDKIEMGQISG